MNRHGIAAGRAAVAGRFAGEAPDLKALAAEVDVDRVVVGTLLRSGDQVRATAQLVEAPGGTLLTSLTVQASLDDLFRLQDDVARRVVEALSLPLAGTATTATPDAPRDAQAYQLYLRANELARTYAGLVVARELYQQCLSLDPGFDGLGGDAAFQALGAQAEAGRPEALTAFREAGGERLLGRE